MTQYSFLVTGKIKPYVRMTRRGKFTKPEAIDYMESQRALKWQLKKQMVEKGWEMLPGKTPLAVDLAIGTDKLHISDLDNLLKAVLDAANKIVFLDDCWIDKVHVYRYLSSEHQAVFTVWVR